MKLTISTNYPDWWKRKEQETKEFWLDELGWLEYEPRRSFGDTCNDSNVVEMIQCFPCG